MSNARDKFEEWLGTETCEVHVDESANKNAWFGWQARDAELKAKDAEIAALRESLTIIAANVYGSFAWSRLRIRQEAERVLAEGQKS